jgi:cysteine-rich repeat protein
MVKDSSLMIQLSKKASELMFYEWKYLIENSWLMYIHSSEWWGFAKQRSYNHSAVQIKTVKEKLSRNTEFLLFFIFWVGHYWSDGNNAPASDWNNSENWSDGNNAPASDWNNSENWSDGNNAPASDWNNSENWSDGNNAPASDWNNSENWSDGNNAPASDWNNSENWSGSLPLVLSGLIDLPMMILSGLVEWLSGENTGLQDLASPLSVVYPQDEIGFDDMGRLRVASLQSVLTQGGEPDTTYCSRITNENIKRILGKGKRSSASLEVIGQGNASDLVQDWSKDQSLIKINSTEQLQKVLYQRFETRKETVFDVFFSSSLEDKTEYHRVVMFVGVDGLLYVLDPLRGLKTTEAQSFEDYMKYYQDEKKLDIYLSKQWYNPLVSEKILNLTKEYTKSVDGVAVVLPAQTIVLKDKNADSNFADVEQDFVIQKQSDGSIILWDLTSHLQFGKPMQVTIDTDVPDGTKLSVQVQHEWDETFGSRGISTDASAMCEYWLSSSESNIVTVAEGKVVFYTCGASTFILNPTGDGSNEATLWLKADGFVETTTGVQATNGQSLYRWNNIASGANPLIETNTTFRPKFHYSGTSNLNFNPQIYFDGADDRLRGALAILNSKWNYEMFAVSNLGVWNPANQGIDYIINNPAWNSYVAPEMWPVFSQISKEGWTTQAFGYQFVNASDSNLTYLGKSGAVASYGADGNILTATISLIPLQNTANTDWNRVEVGRRAGHGVASWWINEIIVYSGSLTSTQKKWINSYLATKYGISLSQSGSQHYTDSTWNVVWNGSTNAGYKFDIAWIGRDDTSTLYQKISQSINDGDQPTVYLGSYTSNLPTLNASNTNTMDNMDYMYWSANKTWSATFNQSYTANTYTSWGAHFLMNKKWRVSETSDVWVVTIKDPTNKAKYLIVSPDGTFNSANSVEYPLVNDGSWNMITTVNLENGQYFTFGREVFVPGCIDTSLTYWLKADQWAQTAGLPSVSGNLVDTWMDSYANYDATQNTAWSKPIYQGWSSNRFNFNPTLDFGAATRIINVPLNINPVSAWYKPISAYTVYNSKVDSANALRWNDRYTRWIFNVTNNFSNGGGQTFYTASWIAADEAFINHTMLNDWWNPWAMVHINGKNIVLSNTTVNGLEDASRLNMQIWWVGPNRPWMNWEISEVFFYEWFVTGLQKNQVDSYLAIKYGITLSGGTLDYVNGNGGTIWNKTANATYKNDITVIGRDDCQQLNQKQSKSTNKTSLVTVWLWNIASSNILNTSSFGANQTFFAFGDNGLSDYYTVAYAPTSYTPVGSYNRMARVWKTQETNTVWTVELCTTSKASHLLTNPNDPTFTPGTTTEIPLTQSGLNYCATVDLDNAEYFTFGYEIFAPWCVSDSLTHWLKADDSVLQSWWNVNTWVDSTFYGRDAVQTVSANQPKYYATWLNFNPILTFDGSNDRLLYNAQWLAAGNSSRAMFVVWDTATNGWYRYTNSYWNTAWWAMFWLSKNWWNNSSTVWFASDLDTTNSWLPINIPHIHHGSYNGTLAGGTMDGNSLQTLARTRNTTISMSGSVGSRIDNIEFWRWDMSEIVMYNKNLTGTEKTRVDSYLASKYGITLSGGTSDYLDGAGSTVWNKTTNTSYRSDVTVIGRDDCQQLNQKQSKSVNSGSIVTMWLWMIATSNALNTNTFATDQTYLAISSNTGTTTVWTWTESPHVDMKRIAREWRASETNGDVWNVVVASALTGVPAWFTVVMIIDWDGNFSNGATWVPMVKSWTEYVTTYNLSDWEFFTFGYTKASIGDTVWYDYDGDGVQDIWESGIGNAKVRLYKDDGNWILNTSSDTLSASWFTTSTWYYNFTWLLSGNYFVYVSNITWLFVTTWSNPTSIIAIEWWEYNTWIDIGLWPQVTLNVNTWAVLETSWSAIYTVLLSSWFVALTGIDVTLVISWSSTATSGSDFSGIVINVTIWSWQTWFDIPLTAIDDLLIEGNEIIILAVLSVYGASLGSPDTQTVTIIDNDTAIVNITWGTTIYETGGTAWIAVYLSSGVLAPTDITVTLSVTGSSAMGSDYSWYSPTVVILSWTNSAFFVMNAVQDLYYEPSTEKVILNISNISWFTATTGFTTTTVYIISDDMLPAVGILDGDTINENGWSDTLSLVVTWWVATGDIDVLISYAGTADGTDFTGQLVVLVPAGSTGVTFSINAIDDVFGEWNETVITSISSLSWNAVMSIDGAFPSTTTTILDDEWLPAILLWVNTGSIDEVWWIVTVTLATSGNAVSSTWIVVTLAYAGTATDGVDYTTWTITVVIPAWNTGASFTLTAIDDLGIEWTEDIMIDITNVENGTEAGTQQQTVNILDNDGCGDAVLNPTEQCDDGNLSNDDGCSAMCMLETPVCYGIFFSANPIYPAEVVTISASWSVWASGTLLYSGNILVDGNPISYGTSFTNTGIYNFVFELNNPLSGSLVASCNENITVIEAPIDGMCNANIVGQTYYDGNTPDTSLLCTSWVLANLSTWMNSWTWDCNWQFSGSDDLACTLNVSYCGDGVVGTGIWYAGTEQCDDSNNTNGDGCSAMCQLEIPEILLTVTTGSINEAGWSVDVTVSTSGAHVSLTWIIVTLAYAGTATDGVDYTTWTITIVIPAWNTGASFTLTAIDDLDIEWTEDIIIDITNVENGTEAGTQQQTFNILDDDVAVVNITGSTTIYETGGDSTITLYLSDWVITLSDIVVTLSINWTALPGDYTGALTTVTIPWWSNSASFDVSAIQDLYYEPTAESVIFDITSISWFNASTWNSNTSLDIVSDDTLPAVGILDGDTINENGWSDTLSLVVTWWVATGDIDVLISYAGTADGTDFTGQLVVLVPAGSTGVTFSINAIDDAISESDETVITSISSLSWNAVMSIDGAFPSTTTTILDDEWLPAILLWVNTGSIYEVWWIVTVTLATSGNAVSSTWIVVTLAYAWTATDGVDYTTWTITVVIPAWNTGASFTLTAIDDLDIEWTEDIMIDITNVENGTEAGTQQQTINILDNDVAVPSCVAVPDPTNGPVTVTCTAVTSGNTVSIPWLVCIPSPSDGWDVTCTGTVTWSDPTITITDPAGNTATGTLPVTLDTTPPTVPSCVAVPDPTNGPVTVTCTAVTSGDTVSIPWLVCIPSPSDGWDVTCTGTVTWSDPTITITDPAGNTATGTLPVTLDTTPPTVPSCVAVPDPTNGPVTVTCTAVTSGNTVSIPWLVCIPSPSDGWDVTCTGTVTWSDPTITITDPAGNTATGTLPVTLDTTPPTVPSCVAVPDPTNGPVTVTCTAVTSGNTVSIPWLVCIPSPSDGWDVTCTGTVTWSDPTITITDPAGNTATGTLPVTLDTTPPTVPSCVAVPDPTNGPVTVTCTAVTSGDTVSIPWLVCIPSPSDGWDVTCTGTVTWSDPTITITDPAGNTATGTLPVTLDTTPPTVPSCVAVPDPTNGPVTVTCTAVTSGDTVSIPWLVCIPSPSDGWDVTCTGTVTWSDPTITITDPAGNTATGTLPVTLDTTPPTVPSCVAVPDPTNGPVTVTCTAVTSGDTVSIPWLVCIPSPSDGWDVTCTGTVTWSDPTITITDPAGNTATGTLPVTLDTTPPTTVPSCHLCCYKW